MALCRSVLVTTTLFLAVILLSFSTTVTSDVHTVFRTFPIHWEDQELIIDDWTTAMGESGRFTTAEFLYSEENSPKLTQCYYTLTLVQVQSKPTDPVSKVVKVSTGIVYPVDTHTYLEKKIVVQYFEDFEKYNHFHVNIRCAIDPTSWTTETTQYGFSGSHFSVSAEYYHGSGTSTWNIENRLIKTKQWSPPQSYIDGNLPPAIFKPLPQSGKYPLGIGLNAITLADLSQMTTAGKGGIAFYSTSSYLLQVIDEDAKSPYEQYCKFNDISIPRSQISFHTIGNTNFVTGGTAFISLNAEQINAIIKNGTPEDKFIQFKIDCNIIQLVAITTEWKETITYDGIGFDTFFLIHNDPDLIEYPYDSVHFSAKKIDDQSEHFC